MLILTSGGLTRPRMPESSTPSPDPGDLLRPPPGHPTTGPQPRPDDELNRHHNPRPMQSHSLRPQLWVRNQRWCAPDCFDGNDVFGSVGEVEWLRTEMANGRFAISK